MEINVQVFFCRKKIVWILKKTPNTQTRYLTIYNKTDLFQIQLHSLKHKTSVLLDQKKVEGDFINLFTLSLNIFVLLWKMFKHMFHKTFTVTFNNWSGIGFRFNNSQTKKQWFQEISNLCFQFFMLL